MIQFGAEESNDKQYAEDEESGGFSGYNEKFYGKYRGVVVNNVDPLGIGRIQARLSGVSGLNVTTFALPCLPVAGKLMGLSVVPPIGSGVWIEFEQGDADKPIWTGCFWGSRAEVPQLAQIPPAPGLDTMVLQTTGQRAIMISDTAGIALQSRVPLGSPVPAILISDAGIMIADGKGGSIAITGGVVTINAGALVIK